MHLDVPESTRPHRKARDREPALRDPQRESTPIDLAERFLAIQRRNAAAIRTRERTERMPSLSLNRAPERPSNHTPVTTAPRGSPTSPRRLPQHHQSEADPDDFSRRLKISNSPSPRTSPKHGAKLFNPDTDPIPMRHTQEPESIPDAAGNSYIPRAASSPVSRNAPIRQLFDHRKDDPIRFAVLPRSGRSAPTPQSSVDYVSASSSSSYANSVTSSITLSSNTDDSSASSALFEHQKKPGEQSSTNTFAIQLKRLYRTISALEDKVKQQDSEEVIDDNRIMLKGKQAENDDLEKDKWKKQIENHKQLAESIHNLLEISLAPSVPASLRNIPTKYNIIIRLWTFAFHKLLESLRRASFSSLIALEHLQDFIYYAYTFYTGLLEEPNLSSFKGGWLEALGDLARYRMAVAAMVTGDVSNGTALTADAVSRAAVDESASESSSRAAHPSSQSESNSGRPVAPVNGSPSPSVGIAAARLLDIEPEKERWRGIARHWYGAGLADTPGTGKLHHHLGLLSREVEGEELRGIYHFVKSMTTLHPFPTSRESVLPLWSAQAQSKRMFPDARAPELFVLLHGMLFTNIQLDDFQPTLARLIERLQIEDVEEREWVMMAVINIGSVLEYGKSSGFLKKHGAVGRDAAAAPPGMRTQRRNGIEEEKMDIDEQREAHHLKPVSVVTAIQTSPTLTPAEPATELPAPLKLAFQLTFTMLTHVLRHPTRKASPFAHTTLNPYLTVLLTFLATILRHPATLEVLERSIPWEELACFFDSIPRSVASRQLRSDPLQPQVPGERWAMLTSGCTPPLPEDWCLRGMEWVGRRVYERGYWKGIEDRRPELEVLDKSEMAQVSDGIIEDGDAEDEDSKKAMCEGTHRWVRIFRSAVGIAAVVDGFTWDEGTRKWTVRGKLNEKVKRWREDDRIERQEEERRRMVRRWSDDSMDVDEEDNLEDDTSDSEADEDDPDEIKTLKARRRYLRSLLQSNTRHRISASPRSRPSRPRKMQKDALVASTLSIVAGYTVLVVDTNILLSSLLIFASLVESFRWTVVVPLPVIMELDGLALNPSPLGDEAQAALAYITSHLRSHAVSLKVQTSKGNYLSTLNVRTEQFDFDDSTSRERNMDDLILKAAIWQDEHWVDRSSLFKDIGLPKDTSRAVKVVLLSLDRNLRLKAKSRQLAAASEKDLASILSTTT